MKKKIYLANPYGFSKQTKKLLSEFTNIFNDLDLEVYEPFQRNSHISQKGDSWAYELAQANFNDLKECDCIFAVVNGTPPDEGVMIELGISIALDKKIFLFRDDFRHCSDNTKYPLNLMLFLGLPKDNWQKFYFESLEEITCDHKGFLEWAKDL